MQIPIHFKLGGIFGVEDDAGGMSPFMGSMSPPLATKLTISGITRDSTGAALPNCTVSLYRTSDTDEVGLGFNNDDYLIEEVISDANGAYSFSTIGPAENYYIIAYSASDSADFTYSPSLPSWITFARSSLATMFDNTGKLTYCPNNVLLYSNDMTNGAWSLSSNVSGTTTTSVTFGAGDGYFYQRLAGMPGANVIVKATLSSPTKSKIALRSVYVGTGLVVNLTTVPTDYYFISITAQAVGQDPDYIGIDNSVSAGGDGLAGTVIISNVSVSIVTHETTPRSQDQVITTSAYYGPRFDHNPVTLALNGLLNEDARTNVVLWNRDLTNAAWTKTSATAVLDQVGIDGVTNSASSLLATGANGTCLQAITLASAAAFQAAYVKRITGSGVINMTMDNGSTWTAITVTDTVNWARISIPTQTLANPTVGFCIVTSGDKIAVDCVDNENGAFATSAIPTTTAAVTRSADVPSLTGLGATEAAAYSSHLEYQNIATGTITPVDFAIGAFAFQPNSWILKVSINKTMAGTTVNTLVGV
jgi:hypothetical protein